jgi:hypothetical protein
MKHLLTPLKRVVRRGGEVDIHDAEGDRILLMDGLSHDGEIANEIIKACDAYDGLVEALKRAKDRFEVLDHAKGVAEIDAALLAAKAGP